MSGAGGRGGERGDKCVWEGRATVIRPSADRTVLTTIESSAGAGVGVDEPG